MYKNNIFVVLVFLKKIIVQARLLVVVQKIQTFNFLYFSYNLLLVTSVQQKTDCDSSLVCFAVSRSFRLSGLSPWKVKSVGLQNEFSQLIYFNVLVAPLKVKMKPFIYFLYNVCKSYLFASSRVKKKKEHNFFIYAIDGNRDKISISK